MNNPSDTKRLADAVTALAATFTEILAEKVRAIAQGNEQVLRAIGEETEQKIALKTIDPPVTPKQLAKHLGISRRTVENWMKRGYLPYYKLRRKVLFNLGEVQRHWDERHRRGPSRH